MGGMSEPYRSYVVISRQQIARNYHNVRSVAGPGVEVIAVVKADGYGHGGLEVSRVLTAEGAKWLAVSSVEEGVMLRCGGIGQARILVMSGFLPYESEGLVEHDLTPVLNSLEQIREVERLGRSSGKPIRYHLKVDSGMRRLGTLATVQEILTVIHDAPFAQLEGLMTHLASSADFTSRQTEEQIAYFNAIAAGLRRAGVPVARLHASNTNAIGYGRTQGGHNTVRAGQGLYGYVSPAVGVAPQLRLEVTPALTWKAKLLAVRDIPEGSLVGYDGSFHATRPMRIGILSAGYTDGIFHRLSNRGKVIADGKLTPILGTVSMDLTTVDLSHTAALGPGDEVTLLGREGDATIDALEIANTAGVTLCNTLCNISARVRRIYR